MKKLLTAIAMSIALPAMAHAQAAPPAAKANCCDRMKAGKDCCKDMAKMDHDTQGMAGMSAGQVMPSGNASSASTHQNHQ
jgi:hypothetical protein